jgi:NAD(P)-dependent dehydrogenase (short-subunit alcohol dehydrogenase family)
MKRKTLEKFRLNHQVAIITGGAGFLGTQHAEAIAEVGGIPILWDINGKASREKAIEVAKKFNVKCQGMKIDITDPRAVKKGLKDILKTHRRVHILINNAANDPKVDAEEKLNWSRLENFSVEAWNKDLSVGLTGAFVCSQIIGSHMAQKGGGVILNIVSDLGVVAPDQRIYRKEGLPEEQQAVKPVTYSVVKHGLIGLTKYLATYWADKNIRVNAISPGGVYTDQPGEFVKKLTNLIPMGRMARREEYKAAVLFLISEASSYMTGSNLIIDGGRTCW